MRLTFTQDADRIIVDDTMLDLRSQLTKMAHNQQLSIDHNALTEYQTEFLDRKCATAFITQET
ncbi:MAG: hypothetical protein HOJ43_00210 [Betaproteobacteria bacterium]|nr:hypothetical protein [Betaproteobacteria bacterium]